MKIRCHIVTLFLSIFFSVSVGVSSIEQHVSKTCTCLLTTLGAPRGCRRQRKKTVQRNRDARLDAKLDRTATVTRETTIPSAGAMCSWKEPDAWDHRGAHVAGKADNKPRHSHPEKKFECNKSEFGCMPANDKKRCNSWQAYLAAF